MIIMCILDVKFGIRYQERLQIFGLTRLDKRRVKSDLTDTFKIINGIYEVHKELFFRLDEGDRRAHNRPCLLYTSPSPRD